MSVSKEDSVKVELKLKDGRLYSVDSDDSARSRSGCCSTRAELVVLCAVTMLIWLLLLLPIIIYSQIPVEPSQNCSSNGHHQAEEFNGSRMSNLSTMGTHSTHDTNVAWSSGEHSVPLSHIFDCSNITCRQGFYCEEQGSSATCSPNCYMWTQFPRSTSIAIDFGILLAECIGVISGVATFIVAGMRWRKVLAFPSSLAVYQTIPVMALSIIIIISRTSNGVLYCRSRDLQQSLNHPTHFCTFTGAATYYCLFLLAVLWLCHLVALFWKMKFPLRARSFQKAHRMKYIHITSVAVCFLLPVIPVIILILYYTYGDGESSTEAMEGDVGFGITRFPPLLCTGRRGRIIFYLVAVPSIVIVMIGIALIASLFWIIHKHHGLFTERQSQSKNKISTAERKILIVFVYDVIVLLLILYGRILDVRDRERFLSEINCYFQCESNGVDHGNLCATTTYMNLVTLTMTTISYILLGLFPLVNFLFIIKLRVLNQHLEKWLRPCFRKSPRKEKIVISCRSSSVTPNQDTSSTSSNSAV